MGGKEQNALGAYGERVAARHLTKLGLVVLDRNWRCPSGELDLVLRDGDVLVVCEVKTRRGQRNGHPLEAVGAVKAERLGRLALLWCEHYDVRPAELRLDLVGVLQPRTGPPLVEHVRGVC